MKKALWLMLSATLIPMSLAAQQPAAGGRGGRGGRGGGGGRGGNGDSANEPAMNRPRPIAVRDDVWMENLTWMEVRDAIAAGKNIAIIPAGSQEQSGPYIVDGKSAFIVKADAEAIAKKMGDVLVTPVIWFGAATSDDDFEHLGDAGYPGSYSVRRPVYKDVIRDIAEMTRRAGFKEIILISDDGEPTSALKEVADELNTKWGSTGVHVHYMPEYYAYHNIIDRALPEWGVKVEQENPPIHDFYRVEATLLMANPEYVRLQERIDAHKTTINGQDILPVEQTIANGKKMQDMKVEGVSAAIRKVIAADNAK